MKYLFVLVFILSIPLTTATSMGISPARIIKENLMPGSELHDIIILSKSSEQNVEILSEVHGDAKEWIIHPRKIIFDENSKNLRIPLEIKVPENTELGNYSAIINYFVVGDSNLHMAFSFPISLNVTDKKDFNYQIKHVEVRQENNQTVILFEVHNKGNVFSGPTVIEIEVLNNDNKDIIQKSKAKLGKIKPFTISDNNAVFDTKLKRGNYWVNVKLSSKNQKFNEMVFLEVSSPSNNKLTGHTVKEVQNKNLFLQNQLLTLLFLTFTVSIFIIISIKRIK